MKILEKKFTYKNFEHVQLFREGNLAIYSQKIAGGKSEKFEVIIIDSHNGYEIAGQKFPPSEMYPSSNQWGVKGFTLLTYEDAMDKINVLKKKLKRAKK
jgi:hypothetical protein